jgi:hypothetical protein
METTVTTSNVAIRYGLIVGVALIVYTLILQLSGQAGNTALAMLSYIILIAGIVLGHNYFKTNGDGFMTMGQGIGIGTLISLISGVLSGIFSYIYIQFVDSSTVTQAIEEARIKMEEQGLSDEQIDQAMAISEKFMSPPMLAIIGIIGIVFFGFLLSLIISLFTKKNNPETQL